MHVFTENDWLVMMKSKTTIWQGAAIVSCILMLIPDLGRLHYIQHFNYVMGVVYTLNTVTKSFL